MPIRADNDPRYSRRFLFIGLFAIGYALYCVYDGTIGYPSERAKGFEEFKSDYPTSFEDVRFSGISLAEFEQQADEERRNKWDQYTHDREIHSGPDIVMQFIMAAATGAVGLLLVSIPLRARGRWIESTESGLTSSWGQSFNFDQVESVDKRKWRGKGIAKVTYRDGNRKRRFVIDDYKFDRYPTDGILFELEQQIGSDKIAGGPPEPSAEADDAHLAEAAPSPATDPS